MPARDPSPLVLIAALLVIALAVGGGIILLLAARTPPVTITINPPAPTAAPPPSATPAPIKVYVTGAVAAPGVVTLPPGSRMADAIAAAGGAAVNADLERVNLAALAQDGQQIHIYAQGEAPQAAQGAPTPAAGNAGQSVVHVNSASLEQLESLPGIGPALAQRIIDYRTAHGPFTSLESLTAVSGIGDAIVQKLAGLVAFD